MERPVARSWFFLLPLVFAVKAEFLPNCASDEDYGWPRFHSLQELQASKWAAYFRFVYGDLPTQYPVCTYDFWQLDQTAYTAAGLDKAPGHKVPVTSPEDLKEGDLIGPAAWSAQSHFANSRSRKPFPNVIPQLGIYHATWKPVPNNTWVEVAHAAVPTELMGSWQWRQRGSGIWFNAGRTLVFPTPKSATLIHHAAIKFLTENCSKSISKNWPEKESDIFGLCAREKGYDSIQFEPTTGVSPIGTFGLVGFTELVIVNLDGQYACGTEDANKTTLRGGWMASQQCTCRNEPTPEHCGLEDCPKTMPFGCFPAMCETPPCAMASCQQTSCVM